jgi:hypothetical protein
VFLCLSMTAFGLACSLERSRSRTIPSAAGVGDVYLLTTASGPTGSRRMSMINSCLKQKLHFTIQSFDWISYILSEANQQSQVAFHFGFSINQKIMWQAMI